MNVLVCVKQIPDQCLDTLVITELDMRRAAPAERRNEYRQPLRPTADRRPVCLHLLAWLGLEPNDRLNRRRRPLVR